MTAPPPITVSGGGSIAVDTGPMLAAARLLDRVEDQLRTLATRIDEIGAAAEWSSVAPDRRATAGSALAAAGSASATASRAAADAAAGLALAAIRYGAAEQVATTATRAAAAGIAATVGAAVRLGAAVSPGAAAVIVLSVVGFAAVVDGPIVLGRLVRGEDPLTDPVLLTELGLAIDSIDDATRGFLGLERPSNLFVDRPDDPFGAAAVAGGLAAAEQFLLPASRRLVVEPVEPAPVPFAAPDSLEALAARMPAARPGEPQIRIERYAGADGVVRFIVSIAGTVTFDADSGSEPFDLRSDLQGVAGVDSTSEDAVLQAMAASGIRQGDPVLLIGHSQGALDAVRIAERGDYDVAGVVTLGGPSGRLTLPTTVPELRVEHGNDPVPVLGGLAAAGVAGRRGVLVRRVVPVSELANEPVAAHDERTYAASVGLAERSGAPQVRSFEASVAPFLTGGDGTAVDWRADRESGRRAPVRDRTIRPKEQ